MSESDLPVNNPTPSLSPLATLWCAIVVDPHTVQTLHDNHNLKTITGINLSVLLLHILQTPAKFDVTKEVDCEPYDAVEILEGVRVRVQDLSPRIQTQIEVLTQVSGDTCYFHSVEDIRRSNLPEEVKEVTLQNLREFKGCTLLSVFSNEDRARLRIDLACRVVYHVALCGNWVAIDGAVSRIASVPPYLRRGRSPTVDTFISRVPPNRILELVRNHVT